MVLIKGRLCIIKATIADYLVLLDCTIFIRGNTPQTHQNAGQVSADLHDLRFVFYLGFSFNQ